MLKNMLLGSTMFAPLWSPDDPAGDAPKTEDENKAGQESQDGESKNKDEAAEKAADVAAADKAADTGDEDAAKAKEQQEQQEQRDWRDHQMARDRRRAKQYQQELAETQAKLRDAQALLERRAAGDEDDTSRQERAVPSRVDPNSPEVQQVAAHLAAQAQYQRDCEAVNLTGKKDYGEKWDKALATLGDLGGFDPDTMSGILATDDPAKVLFELGANPSEYHRIIELTPARRQTELVKMAIVKKTTAKPSNAPAPIEPITGGRGGKPAVDLYDDKVQDEDWYAKRRKEKEERWKAKQAGAVA